MSKHTPYWFRVCQNAIKRKAEGKEPFTQEHRDRAGKWADCACGRQDPRIPRYPSGWPIGANCPIDDMLRHLGGNFSFFVKSDLPEEALETLLKIEKRAAEVLAEVSDGA